MTNSRFNRYFPIGILILGTGTVITAFTVKDPLQGRLTVTKVETNIDSVKIRFSPVKGAADYRIYEESHPEKVKYAGLEHHADPVHPGKILSTPCTQIEWNGVTPNHSTPLVIEAVDKLGPTPLSNQLIEDSKSNVAPGAPAPICTGNESAMIGSNSGPTPDGKTSTNGQGIAGNNPHVLARSKVIMVTAIPRKVLPSGPDAKQVFFDTFSSAEITSIGTPNPLKGERQYTLRSPEAEWDLQFQGCDLAYSQPFVMDRHYMDLLFDGSRGEEKHKGRSASALSPKPTADFRDGRILHLTMEVDGHLDGHRWVAFNLSPADDPLTDLYWAHRTTPVNRTNQGFFCEVNDTKIIMGVIDGSLKNGNTVQIPNSIITQGDVRSGVLANRGKPNGRGLDNRSRFDLFLSKTHYALYEDAKPVSAGEIVGGLPFEQAKIYFSHFLFHSSDGLFALKTHSPHEKYWIEQFPYSDERHWDNMGFEVLPATTNWLGLLSRIR